LTTASPSFSLSQPDDGSGVGQHVSNNLLSVLVDYNQTPNTASVQRQANRSLMSGPI
jgi:hypothetical protein